jgi:hypothetical protein
MPILRSIRVCLAGLALLIAATASAWSQPAAPDAVTEAVEAAPTPAPEAVIVGAYINDIQGLDFRANNYVVDLYVWFRWKDRELDPSATMEFMNRFASDDNLREALFDTPQEMPDGSLYSIIRYQRRFSTKFPLETYPFDTQLLRVVMEDTVSADDRQIYVPDTEGGIALAPNITLPGFHIGEPTMDRLEPLPHEFRRYLRTRNNRLLTVHFGGSGNATDRAMSIKTFVPIFLIVICTTLIF